MKRAMPEIFFGKPEGMGTLEVVVVDRRVTLKWNLQIYDGKVMCCTYVAQDGTQLCCEHSHETSGVISCRNLI